MGRRGRSLFGLVLVGCGAVALYLWRNRRTARDYARAILAPATDRVRSFVRRALRHQAEPVHVEARLITKQLITGLTAPEARPLTTLDQLLSWSPDPATDPDSPFCRTYNAPLMLPSATTPPAAGFLGAALPPLSPSPSPPPPPPPPPAEPLPAASAATTPFACATSAAAGPGDPGPSPDGGGLCSSGRPRLLVCHDMMGGYLEDLWVQGAVDPGAFRLWQWDLIDAFIYFSHHMVTVPPPGWIAAAHRNGVRVLGTFITEAWEGGRHRCEALLASPASARAGADALAALAAHRGFEGWLVNIENGLPRERVPHLVTFVGHLRARLAALVGPNAMVVWYDAITAEGRLDWQNGLTRLNAPFFDAADALFVNYTWREGAPAQVAAAAGSRAADVFMGVDVFGRGSFRGGKDNCHEALAAARSAGVSAALFAPGWVYEEFPRDSFEPRQEAFWARIRSVWPPRPALLQRLPLASCFNGGAGRGVWLEGRRVSSAPWYNLAAQDVVAAASPLQAPHPDASGSPPGPLRVRPTQQLAFCGGSCLHLQLEGGEEAEAEALLPTQMGPWLHDLYTAHVPVPCTGLDLSYTVACSGASRVALLLRTAPPPAAVGTAQQAKAPEVAAEGPRDPWVGVAVGPWVPGDKPVIEALRRAGYLCVVGPTSDTGAVTCPLPELSAVATVPAAAATSAPAGLPWVTCSAHLPYSFVAGPSAGSGCGGAVITSVGIACYRAAASSGVPAAVASGGSGAAGAGGGAGSSSGRASARGSTTGFTGSAGSSAPAAGAATAAESGEGAPYRAFLGRLVLREHRPACGGPQGPAALADGAAVAAALTAAATVEPTGSAAAAAAAVAAGPLGLPLAATAPPPPQASPPLSGGCCFRIKWSRPGASRPRSLRASFNSLTGAGREPAVDPRVSGELVDENDDDDDDDWERSSSGGGVGTTGESPVKVIVPLVGAAPAIEGETVLTGDNGGEEDAARLLTCELSWQPQFDVYGMPRHRSYHVWAHFSAAEAPAGATGAREPPTASPAGIAGVRRTGGSSEEREGSWEVLLPDWSGAVWAGEAFVARYRLVQLEVPAWARSVSLLVQPVAWETSELAPVPQLLARLGVPPLE